MTPPARHTIEAWRFAFGGWLRAIQRRIRAGRRAAAMLTKPCVSAHVITSILSRSAVLILERGASITTSATFGHPAWWTGSPNPPVLQRLRCFYVGRRLLGVADATVKAGKTAQCFADPLPRGRCESPCTSHRGCQGQKRAICTYSRGRHSAPGGRAHGAEQAGRFSPWKRRNRLRCLVQQAAARHKRGTQGSLDDGATGS